MASEVELKLEVPASAASAALRLPWLRKLATGPVKREKLISVYFDTRKFKLRRHGLTLRVRRIGRKRIQTIKADSNGAEGAFGRKEWEDEIECDEPDLKRVEGTALAPLAKGLRKKLRPIFETVVARSTLTIDAGDTMTEIAADGGKIKAPGHSEAIHEIELELKKGSPAKLADVTERLAKTVRATLGLKSKAERGYALIDDAPSRASSAEKIVLDRGLSAAAGLKAIGHSCLRHIAANRDPILDGDPEGVHQMRVGLRRLRAALSLFKDLLHDQETENLKADLRWLTEQMGPARDFDVFVREAVAPLQAETGNPEIAILKCDLEHQREAGFERAREAVESDRYRQIVLRTGLWLIAGDRTTDPDPLRQVQHTRALRDFVGELLTGRTRKITRRVKKIESLDDGLRHKLRIAVKKLGYAVEFFESLFDEKKTRSDRKAFEQALKDLQGALGKLHDVAVHEQFASRMVHQRRHTTRPSEKAFAMGFVIGREQEAVKQCLKAATRAGSRLSKAPAFWR